MARLRVREGEAAVGLGDARRFGPTVERGGCCMESIYLAVCIFRVDGD